MAAQEGLSRREFVRDSGLAAASAALIASPASALAGRSRRRLRPTVAVLGGGVAGLTAAHELAERGFDVSVYEARAFGGKARSWGVPGTAAGGRRPLPAEHSPHIIPGVYQNLPDTLRRIPFAGNEDGVLGNLVPTPALMFAREREDDFWLHARRRSQDSRDPRPAVELVRILAEHVPLHEAVHCVQRVMSFVTSCEARRFGEWEHVTWWDFLSADECSEAFREIVVDFFTRELAAQDTRRTSARSIATLVEAILFHGLGLSGTGALSGCFALPKAEAWWRPWIAHLRHLGVRLHRNSTVTALDVRDGAVRGARVRGPRGEHTVRADWIVCALPAEQARALWSSAVLRVDPRLELTRGLKSRWCNGIQFYLREEVPITNGFVTYGDSPWAVLGISQAQFWSARDMPHDYGDGRVRDCMSVAISDFDAPGVLYGKRARELSPREIAAEVWEQMRRHVGERAPRGLDDDLIVSWHLDPALRYDRAGRRIVANTDPLINNLVGAWDKRPPPGSAIRNLVLAADYVQCSFPPPTTEAANEAARRAVNMILERAGSRAAPCRVFELYEPPGFAELKRADEEAHRRGLPNALDTSPLSLAELANLPLRAR